MPPSADPFTFNPTPAKGGDLAEMAPYVRPVERPETTKGERRSVARMVLWSVWIAFVVLMWLLLVIGDTVSIARGDNPAPPRVVTLNDIATLLGAFFFFYAIDRIIG